MDALIASATLLPLLLAAMLLHPGSRAVALTLAPVAALPALVMGAFWLFSGVPVAALDLPWLFLGARFELDETGRLFLFFSALVWSLAAWYARGYLREDPRKHVFWSFFLASQAGNLGVCLAADAASFYLLFALMTFAAYGLVIHTGSAAARHAAKVYLIMAVIGEAALVAGMLLAVHAAGSHRFIDLAAAPLSTPAALLLIGGFAIKTGTPLLHMWLPLAHPVAPTPASAVLSGLMLKAGLLGWLRFLPLGAQALPEAGLTLAAAGLLAIFFGVVLGLMQRDAKALLAYSSISQLGFMTLAVGVGLRYPSLWSALLPAVGLYALHHALAKSALFLGGGVVRAHGGKPWVLAGLALPALAVAGAPFSGGMLAKVALKAGLYDLPPAWAAVLPWLLALAAIGSTLLMARLLWLCSRQSSPSGGSGLVGPWSMLLLALVIVPVALAPAEIRPSLIEREALIAAAWPLLLGLTLAALAINRRWRGPRIPPGDVLIGLERLHRLLSVLVKRIAGTFLPYNCQLSNRIKLRTARWVRFVSQLK